MSFRVLIIEDDHGLAYEIKRHLGDMGWEVTVARDGRDGLDGALSNSYDLVILDRVLPDGDGLDICRRVRSAPVYTPIVMLSSDTSELGCILGLETGADDYLSKPFSVLELGARVKALFRRIALLRAEEDGRSRNMVRQGDLTIDTEKRTVTLGDNRVHLTAKEFDLLCYLAGHPGRVYTRLHLLNQVWGYGHRGYEHVVNSHINRLRAKIEENPSRPQYILTARGIGYKFSDEM